MKIMGYFEKVVIRLYEQFKTVLAQEEFYQFRFLFEQSCIYETMPSHFVLLIDLTKHLLQKIENTNENIHENMYEMKTQMIYNPSYGPKAMLERKE